MKKQLLACAFILAGLGLTAQTQRVSLYEEFTGETCPPCAATNPGLDILLKSGTNPSKIIPIKWEVPIPSVPSATWSLYKTDKPEIDYRYATYGYGINSAPSHRIDGQSAAAFGATGSQPDHPANLTNAIISSAAAVVSPFAITMTRAWNSNYTAVTLTVNIQASMAFSAVGALKYRLVATEKEIHFATQPGTNGEKDFNWVVRKSYPDIQNGTALASTWTNGQTATLTFSCVLPSYINDLSEVEFVGFIQDDGNRMVMQTAKAGTMAVANDAKADLSPSSYVCGTSFVPQVKILNNGNNPITSFDLAPSLDAVAGSVYNWTGNLAAGASTVVPLSSVNLAAGAHTYAYSINNVSGTDINLTNNSISQKIIGLPASYDANPVVEGFASSFPPANWSLFSANTATAWVKSTQAGGYGLTMESARLDLYYIATGAVVEMILPPVDLGGMQVPTLTFDRAYAPYTGYTDRLQIFASKDCGATWANVYDKTSPQLATRAAITTSYVPTGTEWKTDTVSLPGFNNASVLVKFTATSGLGNDLYIDNVNLKQEDPTSTGIVSNKKNDVGVGIYPNPSNGETTLKISVNSPSNAKISVINVLGQKVYDRSAALNSGSNTVQINVADFAAGVYNVVVESSNGTVVKKLNVTK